MAVTEVRRQSLLDPDTLRRLFRQLAATDVDEMEVESGSSRLYIRREPGTQRAIHSPRRADQSLDAVRIPLEAPLTGVFYARPSPELPRYVEPGDSVQAGQIVGLIETMKLFNEVTAEVSGKVLSVHADDGDLVQAGQALLYFRPHEEGGQE